VPVGLSVALADVAVVGTVDVLSFGRQFRVRRLGVRACFLLGVALVAASKAWPEPFPATARGIALAFGLALLAATFPLYFRYANRCPRCRRAFAEVHDYDGAKIRGLPLFNRIRTCPSCGLDL
jgi:hypothetical protein